nr:biopolymer transporter ExbD [Aliamphritea spongicola]
MAVRPNFEMQEDESGIDMTPMLDIVFIMLIFFIVTTTFVRDAGVEINRPQAQSAEPVKAQGHVSRLPQTVRSGWTNNNWISAWYVLHWNGCGPMSRISGY